MRNQIRGTCASHRTVDLVGLACACLFLGTWLVFKVDDVLVQQTAFVRAHRSALGVVAVGFAVAAGATAGWNACKRGLGHASAPWIAVLPMARATRSRAVMLAALAAMPWRASLVGLIAGWIGTRTGSETPGFHALASVAAFSGAFVAVVIGRQRWRSRAAAPTVAPLRGAAPQAVRWLNWVHWLRGIDSARPRWIGAWECGQHARLQTLAALVSFAVLGGASAAASFAQGWSAPALGVGVVGGNLVFLSVLRGAPLRSPVCGTAPLGFVAAWTGLIRLPLVLSLAWFVPLAGLGAVAQHGQPSAVAASTLALLGGDLIYAMLVAFSPASPTFTMTLYAGVLATAAGETVELGQSTLLVCAAFLAFLWWLGRRRYRGGG